MAIILTFDVMDADYAGEAELRVNGQLVTYIPTEDHPENSMVYVAWQPIDISAYVTEGNNTIEFIAIGTSRMWIKNLYIHENVIEIFRDLTERFNDPDNGIAMLPYAFGIGAPLPLIPIVGPVAAGIGLIFAWVIS